MFIAKEDFLWFKKGDIVPDESVSQNPNWSEHLEQKGSVSVPVPAPVKSAGVLDLNNDGKVDTEDVKVAASTLKKLGARFKKRR